MMIGIVSFPDDEMTVFIYAMKMKENIDGEM